MPAHGPGDLKHHVRRITTDWVWNEVAPAPGRLPIDQLYDTLLPDVPGSRVRNARSLASEEGLIGHVIWVEGATSNTWPAWRDFLASYEQACRNTEGHRRCLFVVLLTGDLAGQAPAEEVTLAHCPWRGVVSDLDALLYAGLLLRERSPEERAPPPKQVHLLTATIARVALWDPWLARALAEKPPLEILAPVPFLREFAGERGWTSATAPTWEDGCQDCVDGQPLVHSAVLATQGAHDQIEVRLWSAQASILLPLVEEQRRAVLARIGSRIPLPQQFEDGRIERLDDLEIGHLARLTDRLSFGPRWNGRIRRLKRVRNHLAHLEPLDPATALSSELYELEATRP